MRDVDYMRVAEDSINTLYFGEILACYETDETFS
jgi:hypothetical protein